VNLTSETISNVGQIPDDASFSESHTFTEQSVAAFGSLIGDSAPIHWNDEFAIRKSFKGRIVYGFLIASPFSRILGMTLPGPHTVIHSVSYKIHRPVYVGQKIIYTVKVNKKVPSVAVVILELSATNELGDIVLSGSAQCGFPRESSHEVQ
jgi:acyl dehydratase